MESGVVKKWKRESEAHKNREKVGKRMKQRGMKERVWGVFETGKEESRRSETKQVG